MQILYVDYDFANVFGLEIREGRDFSQEFPADLTTAFILNEAAVKELGWEGSALGKRMEYFGAGSPEIEKSGTVVGVVKDFHYESLHRPVLPLVLTLTKPDNRDRAVVKISPQNIPATLAFLEQKWNQFVPDWPLQLSFLDKNLDQQYSKEAKLSQIIQYFTILAIFIACLGLFGLASFTAEQRTKEIGVRKVLGASVPNIIFLLSKQFMVLVIAANIIAWPVAYWAMNRWLQEFAYRIDIGWQTFLFAGGAAFVIALLTVSYQAIKAAVANPVKALRYE
jgi:putative ABC transport system permease protein